MIASFFFRTPLHLAACNGNTAALEYLLKQETVLINAVDRFGGTPYVDAIRESFVRHNAGTTQCAGKMVAEEQSFVDEIRWIEFWT